MHRFVHNENLKRFQELLAKESDPAKRAQIERLIAEEEARDPKLCAAKRNPGRLPNLATNEMSGGRNAVRPRRQAR